jgi:hypothetical protein
MNLPLFPLQTLSFLLLCMYIVLGATTLTNILSLWNILGVKNRRGQDISHLNLPPIPELAPIVGTLEKIGFQRLGEFEVVMPLNQVGREWIFTSADYLTCAEAVSTNNGMILFTSTYRDGAVLETGYPMGENISTPDFQSHTITSGIQQAYDYHRAQLPVLGIMHGAPLRIENMDVYMSQDGEYRRRHAPLKFRRFLWIELCKAACEVYALLVSLAAAFYILGREISDTALQQTLTILLIALLPAVLVGAFLLPEIAVWGSKRRPRRKED